MAPAVGAAGYSGGPLPANAVGQMG